MAKRKKRSAREIIARFVKGRYISNTESAAIACSSLHEQVGRNMKMLVPMLQSQYKAAQKSAAYIAANDEGWRVVGHVAKLIDSKWVEVRWEAIDCVLREALTGEQIFAAIRHFLDKEPSIRHLVVHLFTALMDERRLTLLREFLVSNADSVTFSCEYILWVDRIRAERCDMEEICLAIRHEDAITRLFAYTLSVRMFKEMPDKLEQLVLQSGDEDIVYHYKRVILQNL